MSCWPSLLKSPAPAISQFRSVTDGSATEDVGVDPFISQIRFAPVTLLRQMKSGLPSLLKSPRISAAGGGGGAAFTVTVAVELFTVPQLFETRTQ